MLPCFFFEAKSIRPKRERSWSEFGCPGKDSIGVVTQVRGFNQWLIDNWLGGGFEYLLFSSLLGEDSDFD